jgi:hypothetical protein
MRGVQSLPSVTAEQTHHARGGRADIQCKGPVPGVKGHSDEENSVQMEISKW